MPPVDKVSPADWMLQRTLVGCAVAGRSCSNCGAREYQVCQAGEPDVAGKDVIRKFETGATRNNDSDALDYEGFLSPLVVQRFAEYMHKHRFQADGNVRASDNWQKGIPLESYMKSGFRHFMDWWMEHRDLESREGLEDALCALLFNVQGYLHEVLKAKTAGTPES